MWQRPASRARVRPLRVREGLPLAPNEERYVLSEATNSEIYGNPWTLRIRGPLDAERLEAALVWVCQRHEGARTGYEPSPGGRFTRYVEARARPIITRRDLPGASMADLRQAVTGWYFNKVDLTPATLNRFLLVRVARDDHVLGYTLHHATTDGESKDLFMAEAFDRYAGRDDFAPVTPFSEVWDWDWEHSKTYLEARAFWTERMRGLGDIGALPEDGLAEAAERGEACVSLRLGPDLVARTKVAAAEAGVSQFTFYYAAVLALLTRLTGQARVASTFQSGGRRGVAGSEGVYGCFSNSLILATPVDEAESLAAVAQRLKGDIRGAVDHEAFPYHHVIRATGVVPRFGINWFPSLPVVAAPGLEISRPDMAFGRYDYDLNIRFVRDDRDGAIDLLIFHREGVFGHDRVAAIGGRLASLLEAFAADVHAPIAAIHAAQADDPGEPVSGDPGGPVAARFLTHAARAPDAVAIDHGGLAYSYAEVESRSRALALALWRGGVRRGDRVAILAERGPALVWSMLAAVRLGAVFVVLDSAYPEPRLETCLRTAGAGAIVRAGGAGLDDLLDRLVAASSLPPFDADGDVSGACEVMDQAAGLDAVEPDAAAYYLFTSGSTGEPKAVACSHRPLTHFLAWQARAYNLSAADRFSLLSGLSHDPMLRDVFAPLSLGATLVIPSQATLTEPGALAVWMRQAEISVAHITPLLGQLLAAGAASAATPRLRRLFWGGDLLPPALVKAVARLAADCRQVNFYGATETPQAVAAFDCAEDLGRVSVPIGRAVEGAQLLIVGPAGKAVGEGDVGEIAVRSIYPSLGYVAPDGGGALRPAESDRLYRTGDRGLRLPGGAVLLLGRADDQVKVRGHRVELAEVRAALAAHPAVRQAEVVASGEGPDLRLVAFAVLRHGASADETELSRFLAARLPAYMLPRQVRVLASLPLSANGKVDRTAMKHMAQSGPTPARTLDAAPRLEGKAGELAGRWREVLGVADIGPQTTFAALGADSLSYVQVYLATEEVLGAAPPGWHHMTVAELAQSVVDETRFWTTIDSPLLVRAIAIVMVVSGHLHLLSYGGGATSGLMLVSGYLFGKFQLGETFARTAGASILGSLRRLLVPTVLFSLLLFTAKAVVGKHPALSTVLLTADFVDYARLRPPHWGGHEFYLWFIDCMVQTLALLWLAALAWRAVPGLRMGPVRFALAMFTLGCLTRFVAPMFLTPNFLSEGVSPMSPLAHLPTTHLSTMMLGALIAVAQTWRHRVLVAACLVAYVGLSAQLYSLQSALIALAAAALMIAAPRLPLPRPLTALVLALSGASLFIYLTHLPLHGLLAVAHLPDWPLLDVAIALAGGVLTWMGWIRASSWLSRLARAPRATGDDARAAVV